MSGARIASEDLVVTGLIPPGHKVATRAIAKGEPVKRYNQIIGVAREAIGPGSTCTCTTSRWPSSRATTRSASTRSRPTTCEPRRDLHGHPPRRRTRRDAQLHRRADDGELLGDGRARASPTQFRRDVHPEALAEYPNVDGVVALTHGLGCGMDTHGEGIAMLRRTLAGYARHANFAAVLVVGLGCETNQISGVLEASSLKEGDAAAHVHHPGHRRHAEDDRARHRHGAARCCRREPRQARAGAGVAYRASGLQCGGSDGYSGISANPALGAAVDLLVRHGGTAILSETPEIYGAEHLLTRRAVSPRGRRKADRAHRVVGGLHARATARRWTTIRRRATRRAG